MSILLRNFAFSAKEFKSIKSIVAAALLIALHTVLAVFVSIQVTPTPVSYTHLDVYKRQV